MLRFRKKEAIMIKGQNHNILINARQKFLLKKQKNQNLNLIPNPNPIQNQLIETLNIKNKKIFKFRILKKMKIFSTINY